MKGDWRVNRRRHGSVVLAIAAAVMVLSGGCALQGNSAGSGTSASQQASLQSSSQAASESSTLQQAAAQTSTSAASAADSQDQAVLGASRSRIILASNGNVSKKNTKNSATGKTNENKNSAAVAKSTATSGTGNSGTGTVLGKKRKTTASVSATENGNVTGNSTDNTTSGQSSQTQNSNGSSGTASGSTSTPVTPGAVPSEDSYQYIQDGAILQAFCWSFDTITDHLDEIADAGYTAVQTSPVQACLDTNKTMTLGGDGHWYYHYQPTDFTIGNYQLGTEDEFKTMCTEAEKKGIKIIVDVVPNHTTPVKDQVSMNLVNAVGGWDKLYHDTGFTGCTDYDNRYQCTRYEVGGLPDIDTENPAFQNYFIKFLDECIADGADGFRYDSAKHIGLSTDDRPSGVTNNFWQRVTGDITDASDIFNYGEVLQGSSNAVLAECVKEIGATTASNYGGQIRSAVESDNYLTSKVLDYKVGDEINTDHLVTWVESHDNYCNDGTWSQMDDQDVVLGWAIIGARESGTPLFFSRPQGSSTSSQYGDNILGIAGDNNYRDDEVVAVNKFRKAMTGQSEYLANPDGNSAVLMIERGSKGVVIVNGADTAYPIDAKINLEDGTYINMTDDDSVFTVTDGVISGLLPARSVVVLYEKSAASYATVHFYNAQKWASVMVNGSIKATDDGNGWWRAAVKVAGQKEITFSDGGNNTITYPFDTSKLYFAGTKAYATKDEAEEAMQVVKTRVYFYNADCWDNVGAYTYLKGGSTEYLGGWPGKLCVNEGNGWWHVDVPAAVSDDLYIIFNSDVKDGAKQTNDLQLNEQKNVYFAKGVTKGYASKEEALAAVGLTEGATTVYYYNNLGWDAVYAYSWNTGDQYFGGWPGKAAEAAPEIGENWYKATIPAMPSSSLWIIFNNNNNGQQTMDTKISSADNKYMYGKCSTAYATAEAALKAMEESEKPVEKTPTDVYFYNSKNWSDVAAYSWNGTDKLLGDWPGTHATDLGEGWWKVTLPQKPTSETKIIFNDNQTGNQQTQNLDLPDDSKVYLSAENTERYASKEELLKAIGAGSSASQDSSSASSASSAQSSEEQTEESVTVHFYNTGNWDSVSAYAWQDGSGTKYLGDWPGKAMTSDGDGWWNLTIPTAAASDLRVIFNNNGLGAQTDNYTISDSSKTYCRDGNTDSTK